MEGKQGPRPLEVDSTMVSKRNGVILKEKISMGMKLEKGSS